MATKRLSTGERVEIPKKGIERSSDMSKTFVDPVTRTYTGPAPTSRTQETPGLAPAPYQPGGKVATTEAGQRLQRSAGERREERLQELQPPPPVAPPPVAPPKITPTTPGGTPQPSDAPPEAPPKDDRGDGVGAKGETSGGELGDEFTQEDSTGDLRRQQTTLDAVLAGLPPEYQFLGPAIKEQMDSTSRAVAQQGKLYGAEVASADASYKQGKSILDELKADMTQTKDDMKGILDQVKENQRQQLTDEQKAADDRLVWYQQKRERELRSQMKADIEGRTNELGFKGGFGSGNGINAIREAEAGWEQKITELGIEVGMARTDLAVKFNGLWNDTQNNYLLKMGENMREYKKEISTIALTGLGLEEKKAERKQAALRTLVTSVSNLQMGLAKELTGQAVQMGNIIQAQSAAKVQARQWQKDYDFRVTNSERQFQFDQDKFDQEMEFKRQDLESRQGIAIGENFTKQISDRRQLTSDIRNDFNTDPTIKAYETTYLPAYTMWQGALSNFNNPNFKGDKTANLRTLTQAYKQITDGAKAEGVSGGLSVIGFDFLASKAQFTKKDVDAMKSDVENAYWNAKSRRDSKVDGLRAELESRNQMLPPELRVSPSQAGLPYTMPSAEKIQNISNMKYEDRMAQKSLNIGGEVYEGPNEMLLRMKVADDAYFQDYGKHLNFTLSGSSGGYSISLDPTSGSAGYDYMVGSGLQEAASSSAPTGGTLGSFYQGRVTQDFFTPVASREKGGLYEASTVAAWGGTHKGVDIAMPVGTPLEAPTDLVIVEAGKQGGWGNTVLARTSDGAIIRLSHLDSVAVRPGQTIPRGTLLGKSGNTGTSTGPHLDLRVKVNGKYVDPNSYKFS